MTRFINKQSRKSGLPPGSIVYVGGKTQPTKLDYLRYDEDKLDVVDSSDLQNFQDVPTAVDWIHVQGLEDNKLITKMGEALQLHSLILEDIFNSNQRPKTEDMEDGLFVVLKYVTYDKTKQQINLEHLSLILKGNIVISFQNTHEPLFTEIKERILKANGRIRKMKADYLLYALCDWVIDNYFNVLEKLDDEIEELEQLLISDPQQETLQRIYKLKREIIVMRRAVWPMREAIAALNRTDNSVMSESVHIYIRDLYDHAIQVIDTMETFRDMISGMLDMYLTSISNKMNEVMKVLTIFAAIFIPLTFLAGVYGMNFEFIPELSFKWSYPIWWVITIIMGGGMLVLFKKRKWM